MCHPYSNCPAGNSQRKFTTTYLFDASYGIYLPAHIVQLARLVGSCPCWVVQPVTGIIPSCVWQHTRLDSAQPHRL